jgi:hypothetical protein
MEMKLPPIKNPSKLLGRETGWRENPWALLAFMHIHVEFKRKIEGSLTACGWESHWQPTRRNSSARPDDPKQMLLMEEFPAAAFPLYV